MNKISLFAVSLALGLSLASLCFVPTKLSAQTATGSGSFDTAVIKKLGDKVKQAAEEKADLARETLLGLSQQKRGFIGQVERLTAESLTVVNQGETEVIPIDEDVTFLRNGQAIELADIAVEEWLVIMGIIENETFSPKRILVSSASLRPQKHFVELGTIVNQSNNQLELLSRQEEELNINLTKQTEFQDQDGQTVDESALINDLQVLVVGFEDDQGRTAKIIRALAPLGELITDDQSN